MPGKRALILAPLTLALLWGVMSLSAHKFLADADSPSDVATVTPPIVDYIAIFTGMHEAQQQRQLISRLSYGQTVTAGIRDQQIKALQAVVDSAPEGSAERKATQARLDAAETRDKALAKKNEQASERREKQEMVRLFGKIEAAVAVVAAKHNLSVSPQTTQATPANLDAISVEDLRNRLLQRVVRIPDPPQMLTAEVLTYLDAQFDADKRAGNSATDELTTTAE